MATMTALEQKLAALNNAPPETVAKPDSAPKIAARKAAGKGKAKAPPQEISREDKVHIGAWLHKDFKRSLLLIRAETGEDVQTIIARALNAEFRARKVPMVEG